MLTIPAQAGRPDSGLFHLTHGVATGLEAGGDGAQIVTRAFGGFRALGEVGVIPCLVDGPIVALGAICLLLLDRLATLHRRRGGAGFGVGVLVGDAIARDRADRRASGRADEFAVALAEVTADGAADDRADHGAAVVALRLHGACALLIFGPALL